ncbi:MAG: glycosyltransferase [Bacteroidia bacterium]
MSEKRLRVLFVSSWYPNRVRPLLGVFIKRHAQAVAKKCDTSVIYICADEEESIEESNEEGIFTVRVYYKRVRMKIPILAQLIKMSRYFSAWSKAIAVYSGKAGKPDIINSNIVFPVSLMALKLSRKWNIPYIITEHWTGYFPEDGHYKGFLLKMLTRKAVRHASSIVTDSDALMKRMQEIGLVSRYYSIPNVVDTTAFNIAATKKHTGNFNFVHVSVLDEEQKNAPGILRAFASLYEKEPSATLTIVGENPERSNLKELAKSMKINNAVHFAGRKTGDDLVKIFQDAGAFVLFSNYENLPCVMLEALCCGIPVIGTRVGDIAKYLTPSNGILVDPHNEKQLLAAMVNIIQNRSKYNPPEIRASVAGKVNSEVIANQFSDIYNKVLNRQ